MPTGKDHVCPSDRKPWKHIAVLFDTSATSILFHVDGSKIALPRVECPEIPHRGRHMSECFSRAIENLVGVSYDLNFLYCSRNESFRRHLWEPSRAMFECADIYDGQKTNPPNSAYKWLDMDRTRILSCEHTLQFASKEDACGFFDAFRIDQEVFSKDELQPWERPQWFEKTTKNATLALKNLGIAVVPPFEQHQISPSGAVLRVTTNKGRVYLKGNTKKEIAAVQCASSFAPYLVRKPLYVNAEDNWYLMEDYGETLCDTFSREDFKCILELHGKLQAESTKHIAELECAGVPRERGETIYKRVAAILQDAEICELLGACGCVTLVKDEGKIDLTLYCNQTLKFLNRIYEEGKAPMGLVHGDLHDDNMVKVEGKQNEYIIYDWGSARIDVPFFDAVDLEDQVMPGERKSNERIGIDSYLELWTEYGSVSELRDMCYFVSVTDHLRQILKEYERAKRRRVKPLLTKTYSCFLGRVLEAVRERMVRGCWPEKGPICR